MWVLGSKPRSPGRAASLLEAEPLSSPEKKKKMEGRRGGEAEFLTCNLGRPGTQLKD